MHYDIPSSSPPHRPGDNWNTPKRARVRVDPRDFQHYTEQLTCKIEDVIEVGGLATIN
jgi:hypothetical protein